MNRIMLDIETLATGTNAAITSIGAVKFGGGEILDSFYYRVDLDSCMNYGLEIHPNTIMWWMSQSDDARSELTNSDTTDIVLALEWFSLFAGEDAEVWGNGATFDNVNLRNAYEKCGLKTPWSFRKDMCYRTIKNLYPDIKLEREGTHHNALDDAKSQAIHLMKMIPSL